MRQHFAPSGPETPIKEALYEHVRTTQPCPWVKRAARVTQRQKNDRAYRTTDSDSLNDPEAVRRWERVALGMLLITSNSEDLIDRLRPEDFATVGHEVICAAIQGRCRSDGPIDAMQVLKDVIAERAILPLGDPATYLSACRSVAANSVGDFSHYAGLVRKAAEIRTVRALLARAEQALEAGNLGILRDTFERGSTAIGERFDIPAQRRRVDLTPFLNGTFSNPSPSVGGLHERGAHLLYRGRWHTCIGLTTAGKSWFALWHCVAELRAGSTVAYAHFEEADPAGTLARLRAMAPDLTDQDILERFIWLDCTTAWKAAEWRKAVPEHATLAILDGINAACGQHGWNPSEAAAGGEYRTKFVIPLTARGTCVLSLGHPVKNRERQGERHSYGASGWLDDVDGASFRLEADKKDPIRRESKGRSRLFTVKDRYGQVERLGEINENREAGWYYIGSFKVDSSPERRNTMAWMDGPEITEEGEVRSPIDVLAEQVAQHLADNDGRFASVKKLEDALRAADVQFRASHTSPALLKLVSRGVILWPEVGEKKPRPGWLTELPPASS